MRNNNTNISKITIILTLIHQEKKFLALLVKLEKADAIVKRIVVDLTAIVVVT